MSGIATITQSQRSLIDTERLLQDWSLGAEILQSMKPVFDVSTIIGNQLQPVANATAIVDAVANLTKPYTTVAPLLPKPLGWSLPPMFDTRVLDGLVRPGAEILAAINALPTVPIVTSMLGADVAATSRRLTSIVRGFEQLTSGPFDVLGHAQRTIDSSEPFRAAVAAAARSATHIGPFGAHDQVEIRGRFADVRDVVDDDPELAERIEEHTPEMLEFLRYTSGLGYRDLRALADMYDDGGAMLAQASPIQYVLAAFVGIGSAAVAYTLPDEVAQSAFLGAEVFVAVGVYLAARRKKA